MGRLRDLLGMRAYADAIDAATSELTGSSVALPVQVGPASWAPSEDALSAIVWTDLMGATDTILTRAAAVAIPAVARQRHLLCGTVARCPLRALDGATDAPLPTPRWASRTDGTVHPYHRMLWTVDDLLFHGWSIWRATRGYSDPATSGPGELLAAERIPHERWETDPAGRILVDGELVSADEVIVIPGPHEGILSFGAGALRRTIDNLDAAANAARNPAAYLELHYVGDKPLTPDEKAEVISDWAAARRGQNGGVAFTNKAIELREHGTHESHLLVEGRNADAVDVSRLVSSPASMADATNAGASLTYETTEGRNGEFIDYGVGLYMDAIAARLSMDDVVPRGQRVAFDTSQLRTPTPSGTGPQADD